MAESELRYGFLEILESLKTEKLYMVDYVSEVNERFPDLIAPNLLNDPKFYNFLCLIIIRFVYESYGEDFKNIPNEFLSSLLS